MKFSSVRFFTRGALVCALAFLASSLARAQLMYQVQLNTTGLIGHPAGPFYLDFQLNDGSGSGDGNNSATLSDFSFGGGSASAPQPRWAAPPATFLQALRCRIAPRLMSFSRPSLPARS